MYFGSNGANNVYSFLPTSGTVTNFSGDINAFLKVSLYCMSTSFVTDPVAMQYLTSSQGVSASQYLKTAQAGTEPTSGSGTLKYVVSLYSSFCA